jgi:hypothetical protein
MSLIAFRSIVGASLTAFPAILAGLAVLGGMGLLGAHVTVMSNVIPALVMILGYADGMHLSHAWRKHRDEGKSPLEAEWATQNEVAPACILTALMVAGAFGSLGLSDIALVRGFAISGALAMLVGCPMVLVGHAVGVLLIGRFWARGPTTLDLLQRAEEPSAALARFVVTWSRPIGLISLGLTVVFAAMYWAAPPEHSVREHLPARNAANAALGRYDAEFGGAFGPDRGPWSELPVTAPERLRQIGDIQRAAAGIDGVKPPVGVEPLLMVGGRTIRPQPTNSRPSSTRCRRRPFRVSSAPNPAQRLSSGVREALTHELEARFEALEAAVRRPGGWTSASPGSPWSPTAKRHAPSPTSTGASPLPFSAIYS